MAKKKINLTKESLPKRINGVKIVDVRKEIEREMKRKGFSAYALAKILAPHVTEPTIKNYIDEKSEITSGKLELMMTALGLEVRPKE